MPGTTAAVVYVRPRVSALLTQNTQTGAVLYVSLRDTTGAFSQIGVTSSSNQTNLRAWLPQPSVPLGYAVIDGARVPVMIDEQSWWKFLNYVAEQRLGGITGSNLPDVVSSVTQTQQQSAALSANQSELINQANANAATLATVKQVAQQNALSGSDQIPDPVRYTQNANLR